MAEAVPLQINLLLKDVEALADLDTTRLASAMYKTSGGRVNFKKHEIYSAVTWQRTDEGVIAAVASPLIRVTSDNLMHISSGMRDWVSKHWYPGCELVPDTRPSEAGGWSDPIVYGKITNSNSVAHHVKATQWLGDGEVKRNKKAKAYLHGNPYSLWDPDEYETYNVKKTENPAKIAKSNEFARELEINADACSAVVAPLSSLDSITHEDFENYTGIFHSMLRIIGESTIMDSPDPTVTVGLRSPMLWMDVVSVAACLQGGLGMEEIETVISSLFSKQEREDLHISYNSLLTRYKRARRIMSTTSRASLGVETMMEHAERLNPKSWGEWRKAWVDETLDLIYLKQESTLSGTARVLSRLIRGSCLYDVATRSWFVFDSVRNCWKKGMIEPKMMRFRLKTAFSNKIRDVISSNNADKDLLSNLEACERSLDKKTGKGGRDTIKSELTEMLYSQCFEDIRDKNYDAFPLNNCCIEVVENAGKRDVAIRPHRKQDYNTKVAGVEYDASLSWDSPDVKEVMDFYRKFLPDEETRECVLLWAGSLLWRGNRDRIILYLIGQEGGNGKGAFHETLNSALGAFSKKIKATTIYGYEKGSGSADTDLVALENAALGTIEEVESNRVGRVATLKSISGGGDLPLRPIWGEERSVENTAKLLIIGNKYIHWSEEQAMKDRLCFIRTDTRFSDEAPSDPKQQEKDRHYMSDPLYSKKLAELSHATIWILVEYLKKYVTLTHLPRSAKSKEWSSEYWRTQNIYRNFMNHNYVPVKGAYIPYNTLVQTAKRHFSSSIHRSEYSGEGLLAFIKGEYGIRPPGSGPDVTGYDQERHQLHGFSSECE